MLTYSPAPARRRRLRAAWGVGIAAAVVATGSPAFAAVSSTTVTPAGDAFSGVLTPGTTADFSLGSTTIRCKTSSTSGYVQAAPDNTNPSGPVTSETSAPTYRDCSTNTFFLSATMSTNSRNGAWSIGLQYDPAGSTGILTIPKGGVVVTTSGVASCTTTVAPDGPVTLTGTWTPGTGSSAPKLSFSDVSVPVKVSGSLFCPTSQSMATFSVAYSVTDTTTPTAQIAVTR